MMSKSQGIYKRSINQKYSESPITINGNVGIQKSIMDI
jgi:hypothetical protein